ncbi:hypothetical protein [Methylobacterium sp. Leaf117]|uniref:hypothetical protein n=1 Tax=Methylobacterium sp. Leaf117 TaxID=1736260 RepID=UPI0007019863|nr:hypothetical protein [Methylobacterium sp. Leaf117]KQP83326.1 hypothetical protein ASF57_12180 [Methylobacterium sp. Leaf117]
MNAALDIQPRDFSGINVIRFRDGREIRIDDIGTAEQGRLILTEVDATILAIEDQIDRVDLSTCNGPAWKKRAERALKVKRRQRPTIQARIGELGRAERGTVTLAVREAEMRKVDDKRRAFIRAAYASLGHEACIEIWARAEEREPSVFADRAKVPA